MGKGMIIKSFLKRNGEREQQFIIAQCFTKNEFVLRDFIQERNITVLKGYFDEKMGKYQFVDKNPSQSSRFSEDIKVAISSAIDILNTDNEIQKRLFP